MKYTILLLSAFVILLLTKCQQQKSTFTPVNAALKAAFYWKDGTYWIMRDDLSGKIDTFYVYNSNNHDAMGTASTGHGSTSNNYEQIEMGIKNYSSKANHLDSVDWSLIFFSNEIYISVINKDEIFSYYPFNIGNINPIESIHDSGFVLNIIGTYTQNGHDYTNVAEISHVERKYFYVTPYIDTFYFNADVGFIKMILNKPLDSIKRRVWELQSYYIVK